MIEKIYVWDRAEWISLENFRISQKFKCTDKTSKTLCVCVGGGGGEGAIAPLFPHSPFDYAIIGTYVNMNVLFCAKIRKRGRKTFVMHCWWRRDYQIHLPQSILIESTRSDTYRESSTSQNSYL